MMDNVGRVLSMLPPADARRIIKTVFGELLANPYLQATLDLTPAPGQAPA